MEKETLLSSGEFRGEDRFGVGPTVENHRGQSHVLFAVTLSLSAVRSCSLASPDKAGSHHGAGRTVVPPRPVPAGEQVLQRVWQGGREEKAKQRLCPCSLLELSCLCQTVYGAMRGRGEVQNAREQPSPPGATPWLGTISPVLLGQRSPFKSYFWQNLFFLDTARNCLATQAH